MTTHNISSEAIPLDDQSVDYVFTDPPFGDYIPYAELNQINELWLGATTDRLHEIIVSPSQAKGVSEYGVMMGSVFKEIARVLKPNALATVVFHSAHSKIWQALVQAYSGAGLVVEATSILDKIQASFKQTVSTVSVKGDPLLLLSKQPAKRRSSRSSTEIASEIIRAAHKDHRLDPQRLYSEFVGHCLELGRAIEMDAKTFYALVQSERQRVTETE